MWRGSKLLGSMGAARFMGPRVQGDSLD